MKYMPDEVWALIIDHLEIPAEHISVYSTWLSHQAVEARLAALASLCRTSSRLLRLARPVLYRTLPAARREVRAALVATLQRHPHLAAHVENVDLGQGLVTPEEIAALLLPYYAEPQLRRLPVSDEIGAQVEALVAGEEREEDISVSDIWFAHCISLLPNLKLLDYATRSCDTLVPFLFEDAALEGPATPPRTTALRYTPLAKLEELRLRNEDTELAIGLEPYQDLFLLPRLRTFRGSAVSLCTKLASGRRRRPSTLRHAYLEQSLVGAKGLEDFLRACPALQTLRICWGSSLVGDSELDFDLIGAILRDHGAALETLDLDCRQAFQYEHGATQGKIGSLEKLQQLKRLSVPDDVLAAERRELSETEDEGGNIPVASDRFESLLPESLVFLHLYSGYRERPAIGVVVNGVEASPRRHKKSYIQSIVQGILSSRRLYRLKEVRLEYAARLDIEWDISGWKSKKDSGLLIFYK